MLFEYGYFIVIICLIIFFKDQGDRRHQKLLIENRKLSDKIDYLMKKLKIEQYNESSMHTYQYQQLNQDQKSPLDQQPIQQQPVEQQEVPQQIIQQQPVEQQEVPQQIIQHKEVPQQAISQQPEYSYSSSTRLQNYLNNPTSITKKILNYENWIGVNVIGIAAAILIFIGILYLGVLSVPYLTEDIKLYGMFIISFTLTGIGYLLNLKKPRIIYRLVLGSGIGSCYIAILMTNIYFNRLTDLTTFILLFVWMIVVIFVAKKTNSKELGIIVNIGMIISVTLSFIFGLEEYDLSIIFSYQLLSIIGCLIASCFLFKRIYIAGFISSIILILISSNIVGLILPLTYLYINEYIIFVLLEFLLLNILTCILLYKTKSATNEKINNYLFIFTNICWYLYVFSIGITFEITNILSIIIISILFMKIILFDFYNKKRIISTRSFDYDLIISSSCIATMHLFIDYKYFFVSAIIFTVLFIITRKEIISYIIKVFIILDLLFGFSYHKLFDKLFELEDYSQIIQIIYMVLIIGFICLLGIIEKHILNNEKDKKFYLHLPYYYFIVAIAHVIFGMQYVDSFAISLFFIIMLVANVILELIGFSKRAEIKIIFYILQKAFIWCGLLFIIIETGDSEAVIKWIQLFISVILLAAMYYNKKISEFSREKQFFLCIEILLTMYAAVSLVGGVLLYTYIISLIGMFISVLLIILGFLIKAKYIRFFGLATTLLFILKMVTYDMMEYNSVTKVISFMVGGLICFIISWGYNKINDKILK